MIRLHVWRGLPGCWYWLIHDGGILDLGAASTWPEALAVGVAALEAASVRGAA